MSSATSNFALQMPHRAFYFNTSAHLLRVCQERANNLSELLVGLQNCQDGSIFQHTFRTLEEHHFIREGFSNDFAHWAFSACNEPGLAERLASIDVRAFTSITELRKRIIEIVEEYVTHNPRAADRHARETFYFCASDTVVLPTPFVASTLAEFAEGLRQVSLHSIHHHFIEARLRLKLMSNDFSQWLKEDMNLTEPAREMNHIDIYTATLEDVRWQLVKVVERALA